MEKCVQIIGLPVLDAVTGKKLGNVRDLLLAPKTKRIVAVLVETSVLKLLLKSVSLTDVISMCTDAVVVKDASSLKRYVPASLRKCKDITGSKVYGRGSGDIGVVRDIYFDFPSGLLDGFEISDGMIQDLYEGRKIMPVAGHVEFSEEFIVVGDEMLEEMSNTGGGIKRSMLGKNIKETISRSDET